MDRVMEMTLRDIVSEELASRLENANLTPEEEDQILACFEKAYRCVSQVRIRTHAGVKAWINRILQNLNIDIANKNRQRPQAISLGDLITDGQEPAAVDGDPVTAVLHVEQLSRAAQVHEALHQVLAQLDPPLVRLFCSRFYYRIPFAQIAAHLHISEEAAAMRYQRLRDRIFQEVETLLRCHAPETIEFFTPEQ